MSKRSVTHAPVFYIIILVDPTNLFSNLYYLSNLPKFLDISAKLYNTLQKLMF